MKTKAIGLVGGVVFGFTLAWAHLTDPHVIRDMLLLKEPHVFLIMGSAVAIAAIGVRVLKASRARCLATGEPVGWSVERPRTRHVAGSILFALGWTAAGHCQVEGNTPKLIPKMSGSRRESIATSCGSRNRIFLNLTVPSSLSQDERSRSA